ncbi:MAG: NOB1 family endonuclease [Candidatus Nitrosocaldaceae archaeon]
MKNLDTKYILDSTAFYAGLPSLPIKFYTTPQVIDEVKHIKSRYGFIDLLIETKRLEVIEPNDEYLQRARELSFTSGDIKSLSNADLSIIALALFLNAEVITNDYAIINVLRNVNSNVIGKNIRIGKWVRHCTACNVSYSSVYDICNICGNKLKKRLK